MTNQDDQTTPAWAKKLEQYDLSPAEAGILEAALQAYRRWRQLADRIDADGVLVEGRYADTQRAHPLLGAESQARRAYLAALKQLDIPEDEA